MGLRCTNRYVASLIDTMVVITAINDSTTRIRRGQADAALLRWFGERVARMETDRFAEARTAPQDH